MVSHNYFNTKRNKIKITFSSADPVNLHRNKVLEYSLASFSISNNSSKTYFNPNTCVAGIKRKEEGNSCVRFPLFRVPADSPSLSGPFSKVYHAS